ncbi:MAG TPA: DinB family protein [Thermomicrobiaceae bacterium]|nr:DinB family protein [Thermomicrobiaceae bacterium]
MDAVGLLRQELGQGHEIMEQAVADLPADQLHHRAEGSTIQSIATIYAHTVMSEDHLMSKNVQGLPTRFEREGWAARVGIGMIPFGGDYDSWLASVPGVDFGALRAYAEQVYADTDRYLGTLSQADLDRTVVFVNEMPLGSFLATVVAWHAVHHGGEICALKGALGGKGLPY